MLNPYECAKGLKDAARFGQAEEDIPEGAVHIRVSHTLANEIADCMLAQDAFMTMLKGAMDVAREGCGKIRVELIDQFLEETIKAE